VYVSRMSLHRKLHILKNYLAENEANRPSCSFVPSSYDSRNCIAFFVVLVMQSVFLLVSHFYIITNSFECCLFFQQR
jgi:hypothetical protein